jgi:hypothetical protein
MSMMQAVFRAADADEQMQMRAKNAQMTPAEAVELLKDAQANIQRFLEKSNVRTAAPGHVTTLMQDAFAAYYISAVNSCSDIDQLTHSTT